MSRFLNFENPAYIGSVELPSDKQLEVQTDFIDGKIPEQPLSKIAEVRQSFDSDLTTSTADSEDFVEHNTIPDATTPELISSGSVASLTDEALTPVNTAADNINANESPRSPRKKVPSLRKSVSVSSKTTKKKSKKSLKKSITSMFKSIKSSWKKKTTKLKFTFSGMSLSSIATKSFKRRSKASSENTVVSSEIEQPNQNPEISEEWNNFIEEAAPIERTCTSEEQECPEEQSSPSDLPQPSSARPRRLMYTVDSFEFEEIYYPHHGFNQLYDNFKQTPESQKDSVAAASLGFDEDCSDSASVEENVSMSPLTTEAASDNITLPTESYVCDGALNVSNVKALVNLNTNVEDLPNLSAACEHLLTSGDFVCYHAVCVSSVESPVNFDTDVEILPNLSAACEYLMTSANFIGNHAVCVSNVEAPGKFETDDDALPDLLATCEEDFVCNHAASVSNVEAEIASDKSTLPTESYACDDALKVSTVEAIVNLKTEDNVLPNLPATFEELTPMMIPTANEISESDSSDVLTEVFSSIQVSGVDIVPQVSSISQAAPTMTISRTEGYITNLDSVPYVKIGSPSARRAHPERFHVDDELMYKRSTSVYSNIKDYDLQWQKQFHEEHKDILKLELTLTSIACNLAEIVQRNHKQLRFESDPLFDERYVYPLDVSSYQPDEDSVIEPVDVYDALSYVFEMGDLRCEHAVLAYIYIKRLIRNSGTRLWDFSWRLILLAGILTAIKTFDDGAIYNADFGASFFPDIELDRLNQMEIKFLELLDWKVTVRCSEFASAYFQLRSIS